MTHDRDERLLRMAIAASARSRENGNHPFGALLADEDGEVLLEAENAVVTSGDATAHAEIELVRAASRALPSEVLAGATIYASAEPCAMCAGAIYWGGVGRLVYAMAETDLLAFTGSHPKNPTMALGCRVVLSAGQRRIEVIGPLLAEEAISVHEGFWDN